MPKTMQFYAIVLFTFLATNVARAELIMFQPVVTDANAGVLTVNNIWSQIGLSEKYQHEITSYDSFMASNPTHSNNDFWELTSGGDGAVATMSVGRGSTVELSKMLLWNAGGDMPHNVRTFNLEGSLTGNFSVDSFSILSNQLANPNLGDILNVAPEVFTFSPVVAQYVRLTITDTYFPERPEALRLKEVAFAGTVTAVPEPSSFFLLLSAMGIICLRISQIRRRSLLTC
jgi:hypothetical protein